MCCFYQFKNISGLKEECDIRMDFDTNKYPNIFVSIKSVIFCESVLLLITLRSIGGQHKHTLCHCPNNQIAAKVLNSSLLPFLASDKKVGKQDYMMNLLQIIGCLPSTSVGRSLYEETHEKEAKRYVPCPPSGSKWK